jgi:hypothetical protein
MMDVIFFSMSKVFGQLEELIAVAAFDENVETLGTLFHDGGFHILYVVKLAERAGNVAEVVAHEPYFVVAGRLQTIYQ